MQAEAMQIEAVQVGVAHTEAVQMGQSRAQAASSLVKVGADGVRRLARDVFRRTSSMHAALNQWAFDALGTIRPHECGGCIPREEARCEATHIVWATLDPPATLAGVPCRVGTHRMGWRLVVMQATSQGGTRFDSNVCYPFRLFRLAAGAVCPDGPDIVLEDEHVNDRATIRLVQATSVEVVAGVVNKPHDGKALDCLISSCSDVDAVSTALDLWNTKHDRAGAAASALQTLLDAALNGDGVCPEDASMCIGGA